MEQCGLCAGIARCEPKGLFICCVVLCASISENTAEQQMDICVNYQPEPRVKPLPPGTLGLGHIRYKISALGHTTPAPATRSLDTPDTRSLGPGANRAPDPQVHWAL